MLDFKTTKKILLAIVVHILCVVFTLSHSAEAKITVPALELLQTAVSLQMVIQAFLGLGARATVRTVHVLLLSPESN